MNWLILFVAGLFEVCWAVGLKLSHGLTRPAWAAFTVVTLLLSMALLAYASRSLPIGTAYAVWTGIGVVGTAALGILVLGEPRDLIRLLFLGLIVAGIIGLRLASNS